MKQKQKTIFRMLLLVGLTVFALWFSLHKDAKEVIKMLQNIDPFFFLFSLGLGILYYVLSGVNLHRIAMRYKKDYSYADAMICTFSGAFFNGVTLAGGGQVAQTYLFHKQGFKVRESAGILWMDFIIFQSAVLLFVVALWIGKFVYFYELYGPWLLLAFWGLAVNGFVVIMLYAMVKYPKIYVALSNKVLHLLNKIHVIKDLPATSEKWQNQVAMFTEQITIMKEDKRLVIKLLVVQIFRMMIYYAIPYFAALALRQPIAIHQMLNIMAMSSFIHMLNALTPLPGDSGFTESCFILIFSAIFPWNQASAIMLIWRVATYHMILLIGAFVFIRNSGKREFLKLC